MVLFQGNYTFSKGPEGPTISRGGGGGVKMLISIETCDFPWGVGFRRLI